MALTLKARQHSEEALVKFRAVGSHSVRCMPRSQYKYPTVDERVLADFDRGRVPDARQQADNLLKWLGSQLSSPESLKTETFPALSAIIGTADMTENATGLWYVINYLSRKNLVGLRGPFLDGQNVNCLELSLTFEGWEALAALKKPDGSNSHGERRIAAILVTDIAGSSKLMAMDEAAAVHDFAALERQCQEIATQRGGRLVKGTGDGTLCEFTSVHSALEAALSILRAVNQHNGGKPSERHIRLRAGVTVGDVHSIGSDIMGNAVNLATRLQEVAVPGTVCTTEYPSDDLANKLKILTEDLGLRELKGIGRSIRVVQIAPK